MAIARKNNRTARSSLNLHFGIVRHHCFASPFVNPADERHNGKCDNAKRHMATMPTHLEKPDSNSHHREYQKSEDINREHHFAIDPACSSCLLLHFSPSTRGNPRDKTVAYSPAVSSCPMYKSEVEHQRYICHDQGDSDKNYFGELPAGMFHLP